MVVAAAAGVGMEQKVVSAVVMMAVVALPAEVVIQEDWA